MSSVGLMHYNEHDEMFRYKNDQHHLVCLQAVQTVEYKEDLLSMRVYAKP